MTAAGSIAQSNLLTVSRLKTARSCLRHHRYQYRDGWRPNQDSHALRFGILIHEILEAHARGKEPCWDADLGPVDIVKAQELVRGYFEHWGPFRNVVDIEAQFDCPLPSPDLTHDHPDYRLAGKIDLILEGGVILDHKTSSESLAPESALWQRLAMDSQISQYFIGAESLGHQPTKWVHDVIRKPEIDLLKATPEAKRKYTQAGKLYANQRADDETLDDFRARLRDDIASRPEWYFARKDVVRLESQILAHLNDLWAWAPLLESDARNADSCTRFGTCAFYLVCSTGSSPADHPGSYHRVENVHPELAV